MKQYYYAAMVALLVALFVTGIPAHGQDINVAVNGRQVQFVGTRPLTVQGRVLVPLRGVLEEMGAFVSWVAQTRTVVAQRGGTYVELPVGSQTATVNGNRVTLDVPATIIGGSTMVPLRFLGEALGADVRWEAATRTVLITTDGATPGAPVITSFSTAAAEWLRGGSVLEVIMQGTPGGTATFEIPGVVSAQRMNEISTGRYTARWTVPADSNLTVSGATVIGQLRVGGQERLIQAGSPVSIDTIAPRVRNMLPEPNTTVAQTQPSISAVLDDGAGSGIDVSRAKLLVNNKDVTAEATVTANFVSYRPTQTLPAGQTTVSLTVVDRAGNTTTEQWTFNIRAAADVIKSFTHSDLTNLQPGDVISVTMQAEAGGTASFSITRDGEKLRTQQMQEVTPGVYKGEYTIRRDDNLAGASIVGSLTTKAGETYTTQAQGQIGGVAGPLTAPVIQTPAQGAAVTSPLTISGTAPPNTEVRLRVEYVTTVLGALQLNGVVTEQLVTVGSNGRFTSEPINLGTLVSGKNTQYTLTATVIGASGEESQPTVVTFTRN